LTAEAEHASISPRLRLALFSQARFAGDKESGFMGSLYERSTQDREWLSIFDHPSLAPRRSLVVDGYRTSYIESGKQEAPPVVLIHGGNFQIGAAADRWYPTILPLARSFRVFAVDELGGGDTDPPRNLQDLGDVQVRAAHVLKFVEALDVGPVHLVGQSQGAWIAAYVALKRPDLVRRLVLVDSASLALPDGGMGGPGIATNFATSFLPGTMVNDKLEATAQSVREYFGTMVYDRSMLSDEWVSRLVVLAHKWLPIWEQPWRQFWADGGARNRQQYIVDGVHLGEQVHKLVRPLVIWGKNSVKGIDNGVAFYKRIPDAQFHIFDRANHFLWLDQWKDFNGLVTWYLQGN
jgi:2-hydroxy-6-oxonona-2,4-dienedioate hydrolase